ncbi:hypothetical protein F4677DRAFT_456836 [Hypoxylon crocopeplum]|nr:hypothetical protein F4677DRAFT_456836 [Hypoxylon crocopeplum]
MGSYQRSSFKRPVFSPRPSNTQLAPDLVESSISSLPDLIRFNSRENPDHVFALQSEICHDELIGSGEKSYRASQITFSQLDELIRGCVVWMRRVVTPIDQNRGTDEQNPVALYLESDIGLFIHLAALLSMEIPVLLLSARLSSPSVLHLLKETKAKMILVSRRTQSSLTQDVHDIVEVETVQPYYALAKAGSSNGTKEAADDVQHGSGDRSTLILHSSGTTGLPKPIVLTQRYVLGYAACHQFAPDEDIDWVNLTTLPLYHGFGLLAPCLSLSVGLTCCLPPASVIPATKSTLDLLQAFKCRSLMTVPSIIDDILSLSNEEELKTALGLLAKLEFLAVGGGALKPESGMTLTQHKVKLLNHYGATEIGAVAPIFRPGPDYNWRYLRLRSDLCLELRPIVGSTRFRLVGFPYGWDKHFEVQDELERNPDSADSVMEVRILGRTDDLIVLKTGEKVQPQQLESVLNADSAIRTAVCIGSGFFELAVIIEPVNEDQDESSMKDHVWKLLSAANSSLDHHARITSKNAIIIKPVGTPIPRSDKGSVMRRGVHEVFKEQIEDAYTAMESESLGEDFKLDTNNLEAGVRRLIAAVASNRMDGETMDPNEDFYEKGMDSLQSVFLARLLSSALQTLRPGKENETSRVSVDFIYRNPTIRKLADASARLINSADETRTTEQRDRLEEITALTNEFLAKADQDVQTTAPPAKHVILMTGSTGNLGAHALARLARTRSVDNIICLIRNNQHTTNGATPASPDNKTRSNFSDRQQNALKSAGIELRPEEWDKIELLDLGVLYGSGKAERSAQISSLAGRVTHILHLAWPMDFQRTLQSFEPHIELVQTLIELARRAYATGQATQPVRLLFSSSIAAVRHHKAEGDLRTDGQLRRAVPESAMHDPLVSAPMGYAEAKWVCERILDRTGERLAGQVEPVVVRVGQLSGPEGTSGVWKTEEHIPTLVQASQKVGSFPRLEGVISWLPVDRAAQSLVEILLYKERVGRFLHLENPIRQPTGDVFAIMGHELRLSGPTMIPFEKWLQQATEAGAIRSLESFFKDHFRDLAVGDVILDTMKSRAVSKTLTGSGGLGRELIGEYLRRWRCDGFLK